MDAACIDFINSEFRDFRGRWVRDDLQQPGWLDQFLDKWGLQGPGPLDASTLAALLALRELLRRMIAALAKGPPADSDLAELNAIMHMSLSSRHLTRDHQEYQLELVPLQKDWSWVQAEIAASFAEILVYHDPQRIKICANEYCRGIFYDESKSRTRRYCSVDKCANLWKVRRFRSRHKKPPSSEA